MRFGKRLNKGWRTILIVEIGEYVGTITTYDAIHPFADGKHSIGQKIIKSKYQAKLKIKELDIFLFQISLSYIYTCFFAAGGYGAVFNR